MSRRALMPLPPVAKRQLRWFDGYVRFYLKRNFHALHLLGLADLEQLRDYPVLVCLNHPSWWDPLVALHLSQRFFEGHRQYAPIASQGLAKYRFFERLGFFGIEPGTRSGAARFLRVGEAVLGANDGVLWVTPQGEFADVRRRPLQIERGVGHLASRLRRFAMLPVALEYTFWNERYPEAFACFGHPIMIDDGRASAAPVWNEQFARALEATADILADRVQKRDRAVFTPLLAGAAGIGGIYDLWRAGKARLQGKRWQPEHGSH